jgi:hypothetical protein
MVDGDCLILLLLVVCLPEVIVATNDREESVMLSKATKFMKVGGPKM